MVAATLGIGQGTLGREGVTVRCEVGEVIIIQIQMGDIGHRAGQQDNGRVVSRPVAAMSRAVQIPSRYLSVISYYICIFLNTIPLNCDLSCKSYLVCHNYTPDRVDLTYPGTVRTVVGTHARLTPLNL